MSMSSASNTVRVTYLDGVCPTTVHEAVEEFSAFGEIARLDTSLSAIRGCILVTYFDVRCAQRLLMEYSGCTEPFPAAAHDVRCVRTSMSAFFSLVGVNGGVEVFGDVADLSTVGKEVVIEFYDIRGAQRFLSASGGNASPVPMGSHPSASGGSGVSNSTSWNQHGAQNPAYLLPGPGSQGNYSEVSQNGSIESLARAALMTEDGTGNGNPMGDLRKGDKGNKVEAAKAPRSKVTSKEFQKFEINAESIANGKDKRTTVMVRRLTGPNARADLEGLLDRCGLGKRYNFFYMPCKEHRNVHAGFAFVNFIAPDDVLRLHTAMENGMWSEVTGGSESKSPLVSYARFQGQTELMSHFSSSAIMRDQDPNKRPLFRSSTEEASGLSEVGPPGLPPPGAAGSKSKPPYDQAKKADARMMKVAADLAGSKAAPEDPANILDTSAGA
mmetsp:Transcript_39216/g.92326  ORF Transcript_39216/g.92326 Transcript_39216/m.92326 type:complete len:441 (+) Transcript_39216:152-1474(+)|eukprot:CAMPEP_0178420204 /NCGR_PEP_ID=MMETSP0689_2-20121128/26008_1 /TAXON_ID=160604 /ORGANISM="Amphidinium massartii, Strain CS-259" /LENGTH=440 /DNA_ID=CAMNT_0020041671 /DNA_START=69 /DNA_END=1391 /DNA_ORIENTATION=-